MGAGWYHHESAEPPRRPRCPQVIHRTMSGVSRAATPAVNPVPEEVCPLKSPATAPIPSRSSKDSRPFVNVPACTSARPVPPVSTTWSTRSSTTPSTRRWPGTPRRIEVVLTADGGCEVRDDGRGIPVEMSDPVPRPLGGRGRPDDPPRRRQVRRRRLQGVGRTARRGHLGGQRPVEARRGRDRPRWRAAPHGVRGRRRTGRVT